MVRNYNTKPIFGQSEMQKVKETDKNPSKIYNNYTHYRVWGRDEASRDDVEPLDEIVRNPAIAGKMLGYGNNNTPS